LSKIGSAVEKYASAVKALEEVKGELSDAVIKYIIANSYLPKRCTESAIVEALGIPRSIIRRILADLTEEPVLRIEDYGTIKPYSLEGIGYAIDRNYVSFGREEIKELLGAKEISQRIKDQPTIGYPQIQMDLPDGRTVVRYRGPAANTCLERLTGRFSGYMGANIDAKLIDAFGKETINDLELLCPEIEAFGKTGGVTSFLGALLSREIIDIDPQSPAEEIRKSLIEAIEGQLHFVLRRLEAFAKLLEEKGYDGTIEHFKDHIPAEERYMGENYPPFDYRFRNGYLWATTLALREGCVVAEKIGVDAKLLKGLRGLADSLDLALEHKYRGKEMEGMSLAEWHKKRASKIDM
jgi:hypothetical protein